MIDSQEYANAQNDPPSTLILRFMQNERRAKRLACNDQTCEPSKDADDDTWYGLHCVCK